MLNCLNVAAARQRQINEVRAKLKRECQIVKDQLQVTSENSNTSEEENLLNITVLIMANADGPSDVSLAYVVSGASWMPQYDLYASISTEQKLKTSITLLYQAAVTQSTGEDWSNALLTLSTASPLRGMAVPALEPRFLIVEEEESEDDTEYDGTGSEAGDAPPETISEDSTDISARPKKPTNTSPFAKLPPRHPEPAKKPLIAKFPQIFDTNASNGTISTSLTVPGLSTIHSSQHVNPETHIIRLSRLTTEPVDTEWITVPKHDPTVFLQVSQYSIFANVNIIGNATL